MTKYLKITLSILLLSCLLPLPYGYFQFVRFAGMLVFSYLAYRASDKKNKSEVFIYISLAILFQPFIKIALGRTVWNIVDIVVAVVLLLTITTSSKKK
ncbi:threonine/homoserine/homoserine lactone efflux protein [Flavobacterium sp. 28A]|uniref:DUF6804 family protein n=1 Tax=Flavobacterium sp. 28A TaxID=2735895 RepID=UPI00156EE028|nr:DUF6804 family protein [Flavobacterium sp. 28A]NRT16869.1 threonine/homoserine/homoserine lactone efflux protein [Flavobacterium sp. 28A]